MTRPPRILIIQLKRIGDVLLTTPMVAPLRERYPGCAVTLAIHENARGLAAALPADDVVVFGGALGGGAFWRRVVCGAFDICLDPTGTDRSALTTFLSRADERVTFLRFAAKPMRRVVFGDFVESSVRDRHTVEHHLDLLAPLKAGRGSGALEMKLPPQAAAEASTVLHRAGVGRRFAVVHPGTARAEKFWRAEGWASVIAALRREHGMDVVITGGSAPEESEHIKSILALLPDRGGVFDVAGELSLLGSASVVSSSALLCSTDSAPVQFAEAMGVPVVALYGPTNPFHWCPRRTPHRVVTPAGEGAVAPNYAGRPTAEIREDAVIAAVGALVAETGPRR